MSPIVSNYRLGDFVPPSDITTEPTQANQLVEVFTPHSQIKERISRTVFRKLSASDTSVRRISLFVDMPKTHPKHPNED